MNLCRLSSSIVKCWFFSKSNLNYILLQGGGEGSSSYQSIILTSGDMGVVEEEVTTEIIKTEIQTDDDSDQFLVKHEVVEYEDDVNVKKVFVSKVYLQLKLLQRIFEAFMILINLLFMTKASKH